MIRKKRLGSSGSPQSRHIFMDATSEFTVAPHGNVRDEFTTVMGCSLFDGLPIMGMSFKRAPGTSTSPARAARFEWTGNGRWWMRMVEQ